ncbi:MAG TPA: hypothetical protein VIV15_14935 [Anaerolineales bacterium]
MDASQARRLTSEFQTVYGWLFRYVNGSWWAWDVDLACWDWMGVEQRMGAALLALAEDLFPGEEKLHRQVNQIYRQRELIKELRFPLTRATLPADPRSQ